VAAKRCDCSLCVRRAAVLSASYVPAKDFTPHTNEADVGVYLWNEKVLRNCFCKACGIFVYIADGEGGRDGYRVNLGCVEGVDTFALPVTRIDGKSIPLVGS
jgi:hypothetical protein